MWKFENRLAKLEQWKREERRRLGLDVPDELRAGYGSWEAHQKAAAKYDIGNDIFGNETFTLKPKFRDSAPTN